MSHNKRRWTTPEQQDWLIASFPEYLEAQAKGRYDQFWPKLFQDWFACFPAREPTAEDPTDTEPEPDSGPNAPYDDDDDKEPIPDAQTSKRAGGLSKSKKRPKKVRKPQTIPKEHLSYPPIERANHSDTDT